MAYQWNELKTAEKTVSFWALLESRAFLLLAFDMQCKQSSAKPAILPFVQLFQAVLFRLL